MGVIEPDTILLKLLGAKEKRRKRKEKKCRKCSTVFRKNNNPQSHEVFQKKCTEETR